MQRRSSEKLVQMIFAHDYDNIKMLSMVNR